MTRTGPKRGDISAVPLARGAVAVGLVIHVSKHFKNAMIVGFYPTLYPSMESIDIDSLGTEFIAPPNYVATYLVTHDDGAVIGNRADLVGNMKIPQLRFGNDLYLLDNHVKMLRPEEYDRYAAFRLPGNALLKEELREHFGVDASEPNTETERASALAGPNGGEPSREEHEVTVWVPLRNRTLGTDEDRAEGWDLEDALAAAVETRDAGRFTAVETGEGFRAHILNGPSAEALYAAIEPVLQEHVMPEGSYVVKRYGEAGAREVRIHLTSQGERTLR